MIPHYGPSQRLGTNHLRKHGTTCRAVVWCDRMVVAHCETGEVRVIPLREGCLSYYDIDFEYLVMKSLSLTLGQIKDFYATREVTQFWVANAGCFNDNRRRTYVATTRPGETWSFTEDEMPTTPTPEADMPAATDAAPIINTDPLHERVTLGDSRLPSALVETLHGLFTEGELLRDGASFQELEDGMEVLYADRPSRPQFRLKSRELHVSDLEVAVPLAIFGPWYGRTMGGRQRHVRIWGAPPTDRYDQSEWCVTLYRTEVADG